MFNNKKILALQKQIEELEANLISLKLDTENITNFNDLYDKVLESYNNSKVLINEQLLNYDKKIMENTAIVDERLLSFQAKIDKMNDDTIADLRNELIKKSLEIKTNSSILEENVRSNVHEYLLNGKETIRNELDSQNLKLRETISEMMDENTKFLQDEAKKNISLIRENIEKNEKLIKEHLDNSLTLLSREAENNRAQFQEAFNQHSQLLNENNIKYANEINNKFNSYELNLNELINISISKKINELVIEEVTIKSTEKILEAFNKSLLDIGEKEKKTIIESIKSLITPKLPLINKSQESKEIKPLDKEKELFHENYNKLKLCVETGVIPMIVGPAGTGKSTAAEQLARDLGLDFYMANRIQNTFELVGFVNAAGEYVTTQFYEAYTKGGIFLFDEVDASSPEALVTINAAIAQRLMAFPGHPTALPMHKDFKAICAGNTFGTGSTREYTGRNKLDAATLDRFMIIEWDYDQNLEDKLVNDKDLLKLCWALRLACPSIEKSIIISTRGIITLDKMLSSNRESKVFLIKDLFKQKFFENISKGSLKKIYNSISDECKGNFYLKYIGELSE